MKCQHCDMSELRHQLHFIGGTHVRSRCLDGDGTSWLPIPDLDVPLGGSVCAVDGCGLPVESEACQVHGGAS